MRYGSVNHESEYDHAPLMTLEEHTGCPSSTFMHIQVTHKMHFAFCAKVMSISHVAHHDGTVELLLERGYLSPVALHLEGQLRRLLVELAHWA